MVAEHPNLAALRMRPAVDVASDDRLAEDPVATVEDVMRAAFVAGFRAGAEFAADSVDAHADGLAKNLSIRMPPTVAAGVRSLSVRVRQFAEDEGVLQGAWCDAIEQRRPAPKGRPHRG